MKNLLVYINPSKSFDSNDDGDGEILARIQIDNSYSLGWKKEDILIVTNFEYEYNGVKALVLPDDTFCAVYKYASKIDAIVRLFEQGMIEDKLYWFHDFDAFENNRIDKTGLGLDNVDMGLTDYCRIPRWNAGSFFFKNTTKDIFDKVKTEVYKRGSTSSDYHVTSEEEVLMHLTGTNYNNINNRIKRLNGTYNFGTSWIKSCYQKADKPLKVLHFHPHSKVKDNLQKFMYGVNSLRRPLMSDRLIGVFKHHGVQ